MWPVLVAFGSMLVKDVLSTLNVRWLTAKRWWRAGAADAASDLCVLFSTALVGADVAVDGFTFVNVMSLFAIALASVLGTRLGAVAEGVLN